MLNGIYDKEVQHSDTHNRPQSCLTFILRGYQDHYR